MSKLRNTEPVAPTLGLRPLSARSVVLSVLLGTHPPELPVSALVALGDEFGIAAGTIRTAVSRMAGAGELVATPTGYALTGRLLTRQREQDVGRTTVDGEWDGRWYVVTTLHSRRAAAERREFRSTMEGSKLGELRPDTWMRPTNLTVTLPRPDLIVTVGDLEPASGASLVQSLWDLAATERRAAQLLGGLREVAARLDADSSGPSLADGFTVLAACLRFLRSEPQLPSELAATGPADALRADYPAVEDSLQERLGDLFRATRQKVKRKGEAVSDTVSVQ